MPEKKSKKENAYEFRLALATDLALAERLLSKNPQLIDAAVYGDSETAVHFYATECRADLVEWLIKHGADPNGKADDETPLHAAAQLGHLDVCNVLINAGADVNHKDSVGDTPLHKASAGGYIEVIKALLAAGADPMIKEMCGELPVDQALPRKRDQVAEVFQAHAAKSKMA